MTATTRTFTTVHHTTRGAIRVYVASDGNAYVRWTAGSGFRRFLVDDDRVSGLPQSVRLEKGSMLAMEIANAWQFDSVVG